MLPRKPGLRVLPLIPGPRGAVTGVCTGVHTFTSHVEEPEESGVTRGRVEDVFIDSVVRGGQTVISLYRRGIML